MLRKAGTFWKRPQEHWLSTGQAYASASPFSVLHRAVWVVRHLRRQTPLGELSDQTLAFHCVTANRMAALLRAQRRGASRAGRSRSLEAVGGGAGKGGREEATPPRGSCRDLPAEPSPEPSVHLPAGRNPHLAQRSESCSVRALCAVPAGTRAVVRRGG